MWFFSPRSRLLRALESLSLYNDKGIAWSRRTPDQAAAEREKRLKKINDLIRRVGKSDVPEILLNAVTSGELATDATGKYADSVKDYFLANRAL